MKYSIVIPTYNHCDDLLKPCLESIKQYTDLSDTEVIIVANGCTDNTMEYVHSLGDPFKIIWSDQALGYTKATNLGIQASIGEYVILLNNDTMLLPQPHNHWIKQLELPFINDSTVGLSGPIVHHHGITDRTAAIFFCIMIKRAVFDTIGILDEIFSPGYGEDTDFCIRAEDAGFKIASATDSIYSATLGTNTGDFPIWHKESQTFKEYTDKETAIIKKNNKILQQMYGKKKYSIVIPTYNHCDTLLKPCIESIQKYTDMDDVEIIVVANGCIDNTKEYVTSLKAPVRLVWEDQPLGYPKAINLGIKAAKGEYVILLNNDTVLMDQGKNWWLRLLTIPFDKDPKTGITGPVKFNFACGDIRYEAMGFWLVMMRRSLFDEIGLLDEIFSPGMGEDGDFSIKTTQAGYNLVSVPNDVTGMFEVGILNMGFPIFHVGNGTFDDNRSEKEAIIQRNQKILDERYGKPMEKKIDISIVMPTYNHFHDAFKPSIDAVLQYTDLSNKEVIVVANGCTDETFEYLQTLKDKVRYVWFDDPQGVVRAYNAGIEAAKGEYIVMIDNDATLMPQYVDQWLHVLQKPFLENKNVAASSPFAHEYDDMGFILHSGCTMYKADVLRMVGGFDEIYNPGYFSDPDVAMKIWNAGYECVEVPSRKDDKEYVHGANYFKINFPVMHLGHVQTMDKNKDSAIVQKNRVILYSRYSKSRVKYSIIVPTYNHCEDLLKPCLESIKQHTDLTNVEVIVVANGCTDNTREYVASLGAPFKIIWSDEALGYTKATNLGIQAANGEYIIPFNNDCLLLNQISNTWLNKLEEPMSDPTMGMTGVLELFEPAANINFLVFFCVMIKREVIDKIGLLDEIFSPGFGEDIDFCARMHRAGYKHLCVDEEVIIDGNKVTLFPIWHKNNQTFGNEPTYGDVVERNLKTLNERYGHDNPIATSSIKVAPTMTNNKKYSIVIPTYNHCDDLLKPCVESVLEHSNKDDIELIIVANGCTDNTRQYVESLGNIAKLIWSDEALGYTKATNLGIKAATGEYVVLLNNDTLLLAQPKNNWLDTMVAPMIKDQTVGLTGPLELYDRYADFNVLIFFCVMIRKQLFDKIGILDEIFAPGGGEDIDFTVRANQAGYRHVVVPEPTVYNGVTNVGNFPIWHKNNQTFGEIEEYGKYIIKRNGLINCIRYNKHIKLNLGAGGVEYEGYLSLDKYDDRAHIKMDITTLTDFPDNSVEEILASHVFEHLNPYHSIQILTEWNRVLKPGGKLIMEMPDLERCCAAFASADSGNRYAIANVIYGSVNTTGVGGDDNITSPHLFGWWPDSIRDHLINSGYVNVKTMEEQIPHPMYNFRVEANKPGTLQSAQPMLTVVSPTLDREKLKTIEPGTYDEIFNVDTYRLSETNIKDKTVIDIGANLGLFSLRCVELGAKQVIAVEANPHIYIDLLEYVKPYPQITPMNKAVFSIDNRTVLIYNAHVGSRIEKEGDPVQTITLNSIVKDIQDDNMILKLDCEGAEYDILLSTEKSVLRRFESVHLEIHRQGNLNPMYNDPEIVRDRLTEVGFTRVSYIPFYLWDHDIQGNLVNQREGGVYVEKWVRS